MGERLKIMCDLQVANWVCSLPMNTAAILKDVKVAEWATISDLQDQRIQKKWNAKAWCAQFNNALLIWQQLDIYAKFQQWQKEQGLPVQKKVDDEQWKRAARMLPTFFCIRSGRCCSL